MLAIICKPLAVCLSQSRIISRQVTTHQVTCAVNLSLKWLTRGWGCCKVNLWTTVGCCNYLQMDTKILINQIIRQPQIFLSFKDVDVCVFYFSGIEPYSDEWFSLSLLVDILISAKQVKQLNFVIFLSFFNTLCLFFIYIYILLFFICENS